MTTMCEECGAPLEAGRFHLCPECAVERLEARALEARARAAGGATGELVEVERPTPGIDLLESEIGDAGPIVGTVLRGFKRWLERRHQARVQRYINKRWHGKP